MGIQILPKGLRVSLGIGVLLASMTAAQAAVIYQVNVDTSSLNGSSGNINFQFNPGGSSQSAFVTITGFSSIGGALSGVPAVAGGVSGALPGAVTINNSTAFNDYFHAFTFGTSLQFILTLDGPAIQSPNGTSTSGSTFGLAFFDTAGVTPLITTDPFGFAGIVEVALDGTTSTTGFPASAGNPSAVTFSEVPEPSTLISFSTALIAIGVVARRRAAKH